MSRDPSVVQPTTIHISLVLILICPLPIQPSVMESRILISKRSPTCMPTFSRVRGIGTRQQPAHRHEVRLLRHPQPKNPQVGEAGNSATATVDIDALELPVPF
jgi:hypothetical protein